MPYIKQSQRSDVTPETSTYATNPGELNFSITCLIKEYLDYHSLNYQTINDVVGALEGAKLEFYRRIAAPYEDSKIKENGDVY